MQQHMHCSQPTLRVKKFLKHVLFKDTSTVYESWAFNYEGIVISPLSTACLPLWASAVLLQAGLVVLLRLPDTSQ